MSNSGASIQVTAPGGRRSSVFAAAFAAVVLWGATPIATKLAVAGLDPLAVGMLRTLLAGILALPLILVARLPLPRGRSGLVPGLAVPRHGRGARGRVQHLESVPISRLVSRAPRLTNSRKTVLGLLAISAAGGFVLFPLLFSMGLGATSAAHGALILAILPILTGLMAALAERVWPGPRWWLGACVAFIGTVFLIGQRFGFAVEGPDLQDAGLQDASLGGDLLVLASAFASSAGYVAGARAAREVGTWAVTFWGLLLGSVVLLPLLLFAVAPAGLLQLDSSVWLSLLYLAGVSSILAYGAWYWALGQGDMGRIGLTQFIQPVISLALAAIVLSEAIALPLLLSATAIIGGVTLAQSSRAAARTKP